jgi:NAD(P)-dependent dehydrogenase (short-subunit alcohol dehydrogenase family)
MSENWTTLDIPDLTGKAIIVTGANSGLGFESVREFARQGAQTVLACRNLAKAQASLAQIQAEIPGARAEIIQLDLASLRSIHRFAEAFKAKYSQLNVLLNNAGIMMVPYGITEDGFESQLGTNHLGHFALTGLLIDLLLKTPGARVVSVSSLGHRYASMDFDNLMYEGGKGYLSMGAYNRSKLANMLFTYELQRRFEAVSADAIAAAAHPGVSETSLVDHIKTRWYYKLLSPVSELLWQSAAMGALPIIRAAVDPNVQGGEYFGPSGWMEARGYPKRVKSSLMAKDPDLAKRLWDVSEELTGISYGWPS